MALRNKYTCVIIDDESLGRQLIAGHLVKYENFEILGSFNSGIVALEFLKEKQVDLVFLDIEMPGISGLDLIPLLDVNTKVILTTAYSEFALEAFELNVVDYLVKPITVERFNHAMDRVILQLNTECNAEMYQAQNSKDNFISIKSGYTTIQLSIQEIIYIEAMHKYIKIFTLEKRYTTLMSISAILEILPQNFFRCHRSFILNLNTMLQIQGNKVFTELGEIPVSRSSKPELIKRIN